jgi:3-isopropylmalate/(R)-2-methylmalate dehydratase small subunit
MKEFSGQALFLDRNDINTDEIIPAKYLTENNKEALKSHILEDLHLADFDAGKDITGKNIIVTKSNFGCGKVLPGFSDKTCSTAACWLSNFPVKTLTQY